MIRDSFNRDWWDKMRDADMMGKVARKNLCVLLMLNEHKELGDLSLYYDRTVETYEKHEENLRLGIMYATNVFHKIIDDLCKAKGLGIDWNGHSGLIPEIKNADGRVLI